MSYVARADRDVLSGTMRSVVVAVALLLAVAGAASERVDLAQFVASAEQACSQGRVMTGLTCTGAFGEPYAIDLPGEDLTNQSIPAGISALKKLTRLHLGSTGLSGSIPAELGDLTNLVVLDLSLNPIAGSIPDTLSRLSALEAMQLSVTRLSGPFPTWIGSLTSLTILMFWETDLSGSIPDAVGDLTHLRHIEIGRSSFLEGSFPSSLGKLTSLTEIYFDQCRNLRGSLPASFSGMRSLQRLRVTECPLSGWSIPWQWGVLTALTALDIQLCGVNGSIPASLGGLRSLESLVLASNSLVGSVPSTLSQLSNLTYLDLSFNFLSGQIPSMGASSKETIVYFPYNFFTGVTPMTETCQNNSAAFANNCLPDPDCASRRAADCARFCDTRLGGSGANSACPVGQACTPQPVGGLSQGGVPSVYQCVELPETPVEVPPPGSKEPPLARGVLIAPPLVPPFPPGPRPQSPTPSPGASHLSPSARVGVIAGSVVAGLLLLGAAVGLLLLWRRLHRQRRGGQGGAAVHAVDAEWGESGRGGGAEEAEEAEDPRLEGLRRYSLAELHAATDGFSEKRRLGKGSFGEVYLGLLPMNGAGKGRPDMRGKGERDGVRVAVKRQVLKGSEKQQAEDKETFLNEALVLSRARHVNLVELRGCCCEGSQLLLVLDYAPRGNLKDLIAADEEAVPRQQEPGVTREPVLTWQRRVRLALGAARGLSYLHTQMRPEILHLDVKGANILVGENFDAMVADFGVSKLRREGTQAATLLTERVRGTYGYIDPAFFEEYSLTRKSDVFSFGIVLLELATGWPALDKGGMSVMRRVCAELDEGGGGFQCFMAEAIRKTCPVGPVGQAATGEGITQTSDEQAVSLSHPLFVRLVCLALWCCARQRALRPEMEDVVRVLASIDKGATALGEEGGILDEQGQVRREVVGVLPSSSREASGRSQLNLSLFGSAAASSSRGTGTGASMAGSGSQRGAEAGTCDEV